MDIKIDNLKIRYNGEDVISGFGLDISSGEKVCIDGRSGSGKSSVLKALMGFVIPSKGEIFIAGQRLDEKNVWKLRNHISYVCQEPDLGSNLVIERLREPFGYKANEHLEWDDIKLSELCKKFHLDQKLLNKETVTLSGGEKQRFALIIALLLDREILLLDEPFSALDKTVKSIVKEHFINDNSHTIVFVSHEQELLSIADKTVYL